MHFLLVPQLSIPEHLWQNIYPTDMQDAAFEVLVDIASLDAFWLHTTRKVKAHFSKVNYLT